MFDCVKQEKLALSEYVKATDRWILKIVGEQGWRDVTGGRNEE